MRKRQIKKVETVPVVITVYTDKTFDFVIKTPPTTDLLKKKLILQKVLQSQILIKLAKFLGKILKKLQKLRCPI